MIEPVPLMSAASMSAGPLLTTMQQTPRPPWRTEEEAEDYRNDPRQFLLDRCALWANRCTVFHNWIITATYFLPDYERFASGQKIYRPETTQDEALWQGKVGLVIAKGPLAFVDDEAVKFRGQDVKIGDWLQYDILEARQFTIEQVHCRRLKDTQVFARWDDPRMVY
jgi:hypothetical protein